MSTSLAPLRTYLATAEQLGFPFTYPSGYVESIEPIRQVVQQQDGGLGVWFLRAEESASLAQSFVSDFPLKRLVPFARFDNGDWVAFFDADQPNKMLVTNLGESPLRLHEQAETNYHEFICNVLRGLDLPVPAPEHYGVPRDEA